MWLRFNETCYSPIKFQIFDWENITWRRQTNSQMYISLESLTSLSDSKGHYRRTKTTNQSDEMSSGMSCQKYCKHIHDSNEYCGCHFLSCASGLTVPPHLHHKIPVSLDIFSQPTDSLTQPSRHTSSAPQLTGQPVPTPLTPLSQSKPLKQYISHYSTHPHLLLGPTKTKTVTERKQDYSPVVFIEKVV